MDQLPLLKNGDEININIEDNSINLQISKEEFEKRSKDWRMPKPNYESGALSKYAFLVGSAANGATTHPSNFLKMTKYIRDNKLIQED